MELDFTSLDCLFSTAATQDCFKNIYGKHPKPTPKLIGLYGLNQDD
jgi:hypothetical protein